MNSGARLLPTELIPNTLERILEYLVKRTADTVGARVDRSQVVVVGNVESAGSRSLPVQPEHVDALQDWLSREAGVGHKIIMHSTSVRVERWLFGPGESQQVELSYAFSTRRTMRRSAGPGLSARDRVLLFLRQVTSDVPYAPYVPSPSYQLTPGGRSVSRFIINDFDKEGQPFTRDDTTEVEEAVEAIRWYVGLPDEPPAITQALIEALDDSNPRIVRNAIRDLAQRGDSETAQVFKDLLQAENKELNTRLMLGLWILGEQETARDILEEQYRVDSKFGWLVGWDVRLTTGEEDLPESTLYGPDASEIRGD